MKKILYALLLCFTINFYAAAGSAPVLKDLAYNGGKTLKIIMIASNIAPPEPFISGYTVSLYGTNLWVEGKTRVWIGNTEIPNVKYTRFDESVDIKIHKTTLSGKIKLTTPFGTTTSQYVYTSVAHPFESKCKLSATVSGKWGNAQRTSLLATLTFTNTGEVNCWLYETEARGESFPAASLIVTSDANCYITRNFHMEVNRNNPNLPKIILAPKKTFSSTFDVLKLDSYEQIDCDKTPPPTKLYMKYRTGVHEVYVKSPVFEMAW